MNTGRVLCRAVPACWAVVVVAFVVVACGDSGAGPGTEPPGPPQPPTNRAPQPRGSIPDQTLALDGGAATVDVASNFTDPDGDALSYEASSSNSSVATASVQGSTVTVQPVSLGTARIAVAARDPAGLTARLSFAVTVTGRPDLVAGVSPDSVTVAPGGSFEYAVAVRNQGAAVAAATTSRTFASPDSLITTEDEAVGEATDVPALGPGESTSRIATFAASSSAPPGTVVWVGECVDAVEGESDTDNNCSAGLKVTVTGRPDLVASVSPDSVTVAPGDSFEYAVAIRNHGDAAASETIVRTVVSPDPDLTNSDRTVGQAARVPALGPGESVRGTASMIASPSAQGTVVWLGACVDAVEGESDTDNNCSAGLKVTIRGAGSIRAAAPDAAVWLTARIELGPVEPSSRPNTARVCNGSLSRGAGASAWPFLCRSPGDFVRRPQANHRQENDSGQTK